MKMEENKEFEEMKKSGEFEVFYDEIKDTNGTKTLSIPRKVAEYGSFNKGDYVKCYIKKMSE